MRGAGTPHEAKCQNCGHMKSLHQNETYCKVKKCKCAFFIEDK